MMENGRWTSTVEEGMSLNIKNREAHDLARELARETGETMTDAVTEALRERLARVRKQQGARRVTADDLLEIGRRCAATLSGPPVTHAELLYDERGVPR
jgi:antitoxin VapB